MGSIAWLPLFVPQFGNIEHVERFRWLYVRLSPLEMGGRVCAVAACDLPVDDVLRAKRVLDEDDRSTLMYGGFVDGIVVQSVTIERHSNPHDWSKGRPPLRTFLPPFLPPQLPIPIESFLLANFQLRVPLLCSKSLCFSVFLSSSVWFVSEEAGTCAPWLVTTILMVSPLTWENQMCH